MSDKIISITIRRKREIEDYIIAKDQADADKFQRMSDEDMAAEVAVVYCSTWKLFKIWIWSLWNLRPAKVKRIWRSLNKYKS